ncbi:hypothetical protein BsWGS_23209 [Bradybaena similaris]
MMKRLTFTNLTAHLIVCIVSCVASPTTRRVPTVDSLNAALVSSDGQYLYLFKDNGLIQVSLKYKAEGRLVDVGSIWPGLSGVVDATINNSADGLVYFFKGSGYSLLRNGAITGPHPLQDGWPDIFRNRGVDAAGNRNGRSYFFTGCNFWTPSETVGSNGYLIHDLATINLPCDIDAAWESGADLLISKGNQYWIWGSNVTGPFPLSKSISLCTGNSGLDVIAPLPSPLVCNGDARLCSLTVDKVTLPGSHNAGSGFAGPFVFPPCAYQNHDLSVLEQLRFGIRYLDVDSCWSECGNNLGTCHAGYCAGLLCSMLVQIKTFLVENPTDIVMVNFNHDMTGRDQVIPELVRQVEEVLSPFLNSHFRETGQWPTLEAAVTSGKRLFVMIAKEVTQLSFYAQKLWIIDESHMASTYTLIIALRDCFSVVNSTMDKCRELADQSLLEVSVFGGFGACIDDMMTRCDDFLFSSLEVCSDFRTNAQKAPNVLMVDFPAVTPPHQNVLAAVRQQNARNLLAFQKKCRVRLDAATNMDMGSSSAFFTRDRVLHYSEKDRVQKSSAPLSSLSHSLPPNIDSAISGRYWGKNNQTYFFKGCDYWILENGLASGPFVINETFPGLECDIQAAVGIDSTPYFLKGCNYWTYKRNWKVDGPNSIDYNFPGLPCNIDAALNLNDTVYFFQNNNNSGTYWSYKYFELSQGKSILDWNIDPVICEN